MRTSHIFLILNEERKEEAESTSQDSSNADDDLYIEEFELFFIRIIYY